MKSIAISTSQREEFVDITDRVNEIVRQSSPEDGICYVFCPHTTAGLTVNECADPAVVVDMKVAFGKLVPDEGRWLHLEGNSPAHVKASLTGSSLMIPVIGGSLRLGTWQGVFLCEFDGPRTREVWVRTES
ncbi:MAG: secondary thiamine-phosphate synthase enzyme YjbQ [Candidatus Bipolaricaulota bacterium]